MSLAATDGMREEHMAALVDTPWPDAPHDETCGALIRRHRLARHWSQEKLAEAADVEVGAVRRIEAGRCSPRRGMLATLASALGIETAMAALSERLPAGEQVLTPAPATPKRELVAATPEPIPTGLGFGSLLRRYRLRSGHSQNSLAKVVGVNPSYLNRLESCERDAPTRQVVAALARTLCLAPDETDRLHFAADQVPPSLQKLGGNDSTIAAVQRLLTDDTLSLEARADARAVIEVLCIRWSDRVAYPGVPSGAVRTAGR
jgi:transcriptional regulator with XRE-family HTH domain